MGAKSRRRDFPGRARASKGHWSYRAAEACPGIVGWAWYRRQWRRCGYWSSRWAVNGCVRRRRTSRNEEYFPFVIALGVSLPPVQPGRSNKARAGFVGGESRLVAGLVVGG